jgi:hypothetical protein
MQYAPAGEEAVDFLKEPAWSPEVGNAKGRVRAAFSFVRNPEFAPQLRLLSAPDDPALRANAVRDLRRMRDPSNVPWFVQALDDSSPEARYQAMMGLAETVGLTGHEWTTGVDSFEERGDELIAKWKQWWRDEGMKKYGDLNRAGPDGPDEAPATGPAKGPG